MKPIASNPGTKLSRRKFIQNAAAVGVAAPAALSLLGTTADPVAAAGITPPFSPSSLPQGKKSRVNIALKETGLLKNWPPQVLQAITKMVEANANQGNFAVFDADQTSYQWDLEEALVAYMESKGVISRDKLDPSLVLIPFKDTPDWKESLTSYYYRLDEISVRVSYPWCAQVFSGLKVKDLKLHIDAMMAEGRPLAIKYWEGDKVVESLAHVPNIYRGMNELYNFLMANGIEVYVISASSEELIRALVSDPKYGYNVKPQNVFGLSLMLKDGKGGITNSRLEIEKKSYDPAKIAEMTITPYLVNPATYWEGKYATILGYIDQWRKSVLVGGDTPLSDGFMLQNGVDVDKGGLRIWVNRKDKYTKNMTDMWTKSAKAQGELGLAVTADKNWHVVKPNDLGPKIVNDANKKGDPYIAG
ncbi:MAG: twin-arginine translocation signal domain-containing protein [Candidatus Symbiobacter sp.]|nr:twin-arginine translocation signal domain-containing protein [Candidatus Symbiobacter sp.]